MKRLFLAAGLLLSCLYSFCQQDSMLPPFKRFPTIPPFKLMQSDSSRYFTKSDLKKNRPVLIILFNPDCEHCKHETEEIIKNMNQLQNVQIVMATMAAIDMMKSFIESYQLQKFKNITVGKDFQYLLPTFYQIHFLPYLAMYNKKGNLITTFEGSMKMEDLIRFFKKG